MRGAVAIPQNIPGKIYKVVTTDFQEVVYNESAPAVSVNNCSCKNLNGKVYNNTPVEEVVQDVVSVLNGTYNYSAEDSQPAIDIEQYVRDYIQSNLQNNIELSVRSIVSPQYVLDIFNNMSNSELIHFTSIISSVVPDVIQLIPGNTLAKYTAESELLDWEGLVVGQLKSNTIPNIGHVKELTVGTSVSSLANSTFSLVAVSYLYKIDIPNSVSSIGSKCFEGCYKLVSVNMSDSIKLIKERTFSGCINLRQIEIPEKVEVIQGTAFANCSSLTELQLPDALESIGQYAFSNCTRLSNVVTGSNIQVIGEAAFINCSKLSSISLPETIYNIGADAFRNTALTSITLVGKSTDEATLLLSAAGLPASCEVIIR